MNTNALNILADAISDIGSWWWWDIEGDIVQVEFRDVLLYDESKPEQERHTTDVLAVRFCGHAFAVFLDSLDEDGWYERFRDDDSILYDIDAYDLAFDDIEGAKSLLGDYKNKVPVKDFDGPKTLSAAKHLLYARCDEVGFVIGGDELVVIGNKGEYSEDDIESASRRWWAYWRNYWRLRKTADAYKKDWVCEVTIPVDTDDPQGKWYEEEG